MNFNYKEYWEKRYVTGGNSGKGSYGENAIFKANFINNFCKENNCKTAAEIGCGDGNNLELYDFDFYMGVDVSPTVISMCKRKFEGDTSKTFAVLGEPIFQHGKPDVSLCLDVTYHIFPREEWEHTIQQVIDWAEKYAIFYSFLSPSGHAAHINDYNFIEYIDLLCKKKGCGYTIAADTPPDSQSRFVIIEKKISQENTGVN